jgi:hypothetical protein
VGRNLLLQSDLLLWVVSPRLADLTPGNEAELAFHLAVLYKYLLPDALPRPAPAPAALAVLKPLRALYDQLVADSSPLAVRCETILTEYCGVVVPNSPQLFAAALSRIGLPLVIGDTADLLSHLFQSDPRPSWLDQFTIIKAALDVLNATETPNRERAGVLRGVLVSVVRQTEAVEFFGSLLSRYPATSPLVVQSCWALEQLLQGEAKSAELATCLSTDLERTVTLCTRIVDCGRGPSLAGCSELVRTQLLELARNTQTEPSQHCTTWARFLLRLRLAQALLPHIDSAKEKVEEWIACLFDCVLHPALMTDDSGLTRQAACASIQTLLEALKNDATPMKRKLREGWKKSHELPQFKQDTESLLPFLSSTATLTVLPGLRPADPWKLLEEFDNTELSAESFGAIRFQRDEVPFSASYFTKRPLESGQDPKRIKLSKEL